MIALILFLAQAFTLTVDVIQPATIETIDCRLVSTDLGATPGLIHYRLNQNNLYAMVDCTLLFSDGFEP